jgi:hypothetical protein
MENERRLCSTAEEALRVTPAPPWRGNDDDQDGRARADRMATAATTALSATNHTASDPSHAGRDDDGHHHPFAIIVRAELLLTLPSAAAALGEKRGSSLRSADDGVALEEDARMEFIYRARSTRFQVEK